MRPYRLVSSRHEPLTWSDWPLMVAFTALAAVLFVVTAAVAAVATLVLWNAAVPRVFGLPPIDYWTALWLTLLAWILVRPWVHD
jgi:hypothetical protein